jgi:hypothetical protein
MVVIHTPKRRTAAVRPQFRVSKPDEERERTEVLFREAKRRERRRRLIVLAVIAVVVGVAGIGYAVLRSKNVPHAAQRNFTSLTQRGAGGVGPIVTPESPEALAVGPNGDLYVVDIGRDQILRRLPNGRFQVVAGNGRPGLSGDGGPAIDASIHLEYDAGIAVSTNGAVYFSDSWNDRVREVLPDGIIKTVAGGGKTPLGQGPVPALDALLATGLGRFIAVGGLTIGPGNDLYLALSDGVYRLTASGMLFRVVGEPLNVETDICGWDLNPGCQRDFQPAYRLAFDRAGDLFVAGGGGFGLYERTSSGTLRFIESFRGGGAGFWGSLASDPDGSVVGVSNNGVQKSLPSGEMVSLTKTPKQLASALDLGLGRLPHPPRTGVDVNTFIGGSGIAVGQNDTIYVDMDSGVWSRVSGILAITPNGNVTNLWRS